MRLLILQIVKISFDFLLTYILSKFLQDILFIFLFVEFVLVFFLWHKDFLWSRLLIFLMVTFLWCLLHCFYEFLKMLDQYITVFRPNLRLRYKKWLSSTLTNALIKFLSSRLVIRVLSFSQWLGCFSPAFLIERKTFFNFYFGILWRLSLFWVSSFLIWPICYFRSKRKAVCADYGTPYF